MRKIVLLIVLTLGLTSLSFGQQYNTALGIKGGFPGYGAFSVKHFFGKSAIEGNIGGGARHIWLQGLYEQNYAISGGLDWYWGVGMDIGFWDNDYHYYHDDHHYHGGTWGGLDVVFGLEYTFEEVPINLAADLGPRLRLWPYTGFDFGGAIAVRFAIK